jgi:PAS domain S-box-containing protein/diguanylate cyclase (GGDEF)-like protein
MDQQINHKLANLLSNTEILDSLNDGVYIVDPDRRILYWNQAAEQLTGYKSDEVIGKRCMDDLLTHVDTKGCLLCNKGCPLSQVIETGQKQQINVIMHHRKGYRLPVQVKGNPILGIGGKVIACVEIFKLQMHSENLFDRLTQIENQTLQDPTTKLPNVRFIEKSLKIKLTNAKCSGQPFGMIKLHASKFDQVKMEHGIDTTEKMIQIISQSTVANCQIQHTVGRVAENQLVILCSIKDMDQLKQMAHQLAKVLSRCTCEIQDKRLHIAVNVCCLMILPEQTLESVMSQMTHQISHDHLAA